MNKNRVGDVDLGKGPVICRGANINPQVYKMLCEAARDLNIPFQVNAAGGGTGTDANAMQLNQAGMATGLISIPLRYMHTPCEVVSLRRHRQRRPPDRRLHRAPDPGHRLHALPVQPPPRHPPARQGQKVRGQGRGEMNPEGRSRVAALSLPRPVPSVAAPAVPAKEHLT